MKKKLAAAFVALACVTACFGLDITTRSGTAYRKCEVVKVEPDGIRITHDAGAAKISFEEMPDALRRQYGFDSAKVAAYRKSLADAQDAVQAAAAKKLADEQRQQRQQAQAESLAREEIARKEALEKAGWASQAAAEQDKKADAVAFDLKVGVVAFLTVIGLGIWFCIAAVRSIVAEKRKKEAERFERAQRGRVGQGQIVCPHCQTRGTVTTRQVMLKKGINGGKATAAILTGGISLFFTGLSLEQETTEATCSNCGATWLF
jgi:hypothetical protein